MHFGYDAPQDPFIQDIMEELAEVYDELEPPRLSASAMAAQRRREDAERQRRRRAEMRHTGIPGGRVVDAAISAAVADVFTRIAARAHIVTTGGVDGLYAPVKSILARAKAILVEKGFDRRVAGQALQGRLLASA